MLCLIMSNKISIFIVCHKPVDVISNEVYRPIHVGRAISKCKDEMVGMIGDDTGDNISAKNPYYCELTAQYWAWKNYHNSEYIGFCHYRRFFEIEFTNENIGKILKNDKDVVLFGPRFRMHNRLNYLRTFVSGDDITILFLVVKKLYPDYYRTMCMCANDFLDYPCNMMVCKKTTFDEYAKWLFDILFECEKHVKLSSYSRGQRIYGYLSEFLTTVYFVHNKFRIIGMRCRLTEQDKIIGFGRRNRIKYFIMRHIFFFRQIRTDFCYDNGIMNGLKNDGILI